MANKSGYSGRSLTQTTPTPEFKKRAVVSWVILFGVNLWMLHKLGAVVGYPDMLTRMFGWIPHQLLEVAKWAYLHL